MSEEQSTASPMRKAISWVGYLSAIGLLIFILFTILYSIWFIFYTA